ncbi:MAG: hypothetical protein OM95_14075 [Bdellovibrio sp. ArHS]|uniref:tail fiber domain-containing protein n=1 Tax=Bdellovibrio sp. ArHS TaxID=1569284 RepID=UPI0005834D45|nr:tail fiber domain-containing protein [Bdellovibrio sp. ArHS]KHD87494.1 MAG: hypothetical protein OM95_14075 [Bdellovibrio sp. ArHS]
MYSARLFKIHALLALFGATIYLFSSVAWSQHKGIGFQAVIKKTDGSYPTASGLTVTLQVLSPTGACVLREEQFSNVTITNGYLNLVLGQGDFSAPANYNPSPTLTLAEVFDNSIPRTGLKCVDADNNILDNAGSYVPNSTHSRKLRLRTSLAGDNLVVDLNMRAVPYAVNSEKLNGKDENDFIQTNPAAQVTQSLLESFFSSLTSATGETVRWNGSAFETYDSQDGSSLHNNSVPGSAIADLPWSKITSIPTPVGQLSGLTCVNGKILKMISGTWACGDESGVGVENDPTVQNFAKASVGTGLRVNGSNNLEVDSGTTAGKIVQLDGSGKISASVLPPFGVSNLDFAGAMAVNSGVIVSNGTNFYNKACAADQVLSWTVANGWICSSVSTLVTAAGGLSGNTPISTTATISTTQSVTAGSGVFSLVRIYDGIGKYASIAAPSAGFSNDYVLKLPVDKGAAGQMLKISGVSGANVELTWADSGTVTNVSSANTDITVANGSTTPTLTLNAGTTGGVADANKIAKMNASGLLPTAMIPSLDVAKLTSGILPIARGGTNSTTALNNNRIMISNSGSIVEHTALSANKVLVTNATGLPAAATVTDTELGYLSGVTANIQTQLAAKISGTGWGTNSVITADSSGVLTALGGSTTGSHLQWTVTGPAWTTATFPATTTINQLLYSSGTNVVTGLATANSSVLTTNGSGVPTWSALSNDTFTQYARLAGRSGGQTLSGGTAASENLTLDSTSHATKGPIILNGSGGSVGIGVTSPASKLDVAGPAGVTSFIGTTPLGVTLRGPTSTNDFSGIDFRANTSTAPLARIGVLFSGAGSYMHFGTSNNYASGITKAALTVDPAGRVGVSTTAPTAPLQVTSGSYAAPATSGTTQSGAFLRLSAIGTTTLDFGYAGTGGAWIQNAMSTDLSSNYPLFLNPNGGNVAVGKLAATYAFNVDGDIHTTTCYRAGVGVVGGTCASDERLKTDIQPFKLGLEALQGIAPKYYRYNGLGGQPSSENLELGVIAQDVEKTAPELVTKKFVKLHSEDLDETEIKIVNYNGLIYLVINSVKELYDKVLGTNARVKVLEQENAAKTKEIEELKARLERIENSLSER